MNFIDVVYKTPYMVATGIMPASKELMSMRNINISDDQYAYLEKLARPFVDQPVDVLGRIINDHMAYINVNDAEALGGLHKSYKSQTLPNVAHSILEAAWIDNEPLAKRDWQRLLVEVVSACVRKSNIPEVKAHIFLTFVEGNTPASGHYYVPNADITLQGASAGRILKQVDRLARAFELPVRLSIRWIDTPKAAKPGISEELTLP